MVSSCSISVEHLVRFSLCCIAFLYVSHRTYIVCPSLHLSFICAALHTQFFSSVAGIQETKSKGTDNWSDHNVPARMSSWLYIAMPHLQTAPPIIHQQRVLQTTSLLSLFTTLLACIHCMLIICLVFCSPSTLHLMETE